MQLELYFITFVLASILTSLTELERLRRVRIVYLIIGGILFFISGCLTGLYLGR